jgi:hypothetical protein
VLEPEDQQRIERGQRDPWTPDLVADVVKQRRDILPLDDWDARVRWRDEQLMKFLQRFKVELAEDQPHPATSSSGH